METFLTKSGITQKDIISARNIFPEIFRAFHAFDTSFRIFATHEHV